MQMAVPAIASTVDVPVQPAGVALHVTHNAPLECLVSIAKSIAGVKTQLHVLQSMARVPVNQVGKDDFARYLVRTVPGEVDVPVNAFVKMEQFVTYKVASVAAMLDGKALHVLIRVMKDCMGSTVRKYVVAKTMASAPSKLYLLSFELDSVEIN